MKLLPNITEIFPPNFTGWIRPWSPNVLDAGSNSLSHQCPRAGPAAVTPDRKSSCDVAIVWVYVYLSMLFTKHKITNKWPRF